MSDNEPGILSDTHFENKDSDSEDSNAEDNITDMQSEIDSSVTNGSLSSLFPTHTEIRNIILRSYSIHRKLAS